MNQQQIYYDIKGRLSSVRKKEKWIDLLSGFCFWSIFAVGLIFSLSILEHYFWLSPRIKPGLITIVLFFLIATFIIFILLNLYRLLFDKYHPDDVSIALRIGQFIPKLKDQLADAFQVYEEAMDERSKTSKELADVALQNSYELVQSYRFKDFISTKKLLRVSGLTIVIVFMMVSFVIFNSDLASGLNRMMHPKQAFEKPLSIEFVVHPGNIQLIEGDTLYIQIDVLKGKVSTLDLYLDFEDQNPQKFSLKSSYQFVLEDVKKSGEYWIEMDGHKSPVYTIKIDKRPFVHSFRWTITPPAYTRLKEQKLQNNEGYFSALKGSMLSISLKSTKVLEEASLTWNQKSIPLQVRKNIATGGLRFMQTGQYFFAIQDTLGIQNINPIEYQVQVQPDQFPLIAIRSPGEQVELSEQLILPLSLEAEDDFGVTKMLLKYWIQMPGNPNQNADTMSFEIPITQKYQKYVLQTHTWDLKSFNLFPEDVVYYFVQAADNDVISGPKWGKSEIHLARFPSIFEIFQEVEEEHVHQIESFEDEFQKSKALLEELEKIEQDIQTGQEVTWEEKHELEETLKKQQEIQKNVESLKQDLQEMVEKMDENQLMDTELFEKYQELQELYKDIAKPELLEAMQKFQELIQNMKTPELQKAVERMKIDQEKMMQSLERTINLLKRIQVEQKMEEVIQKVDNMMERQEEINDAIQKNNSIDPTQTRQQQSIKKDHERLKNDLSDLQQMMSDFNDMPNQEMSNFLDSLQQSNQEELFQEMQEQMEQQNVSGSQQKGEQIQQSLGSIKKQLDDMKASMSQNSQQELAKAFQQISHKLMQASQAQEQLGQKTGQNSSSSNQNENAKEQQALQRFTQSIQDSLNMLSQKTLGIMPEMFRSMSKAEKNMNDATQALGNRQSMQAMTFQQQAMGALNQAILEIQNMMNQMNGQGGSGMEQFMNQMNQMTQQQMALNQQLMQMLEQGQLSQVQQAALKRMAGQQQAIQNSLKDIMKQYGSQGEHMGRLDRLIEEMQESVEDMRNAQVDRETLERQEKILSRMLDAQRSIREKDYSKQREGRTAKNVYRQSPEMLRLQKSEIRKQLEKELLHLSEEGYSEEDQQLIRDYFEILLKENVE